MLDIQSLEEQRVSADFVERYDLLFIVLIRQVSSVAAGTEFSQDPPALLGERFIDCPRPPRRLQRLDSRQNILKIVFPASQRVGLVFQEHDELRQHPMVFGSETVSIQSLLFRTFHSGGASMS